MKENVLIFIASHAIILLCCFWALSMLIRMLIRRPSMFVHPWAMLPVLAWLLAEGVVHISYIVLILTQRGHATVIVLLALDAVAALIACIAVRFVFLIIANQPTVSDLRLTTDALAKTLGEVSSEKEPT